MKYDSFLLKADNLPSNLFLQYKYVNSISITLKDKFDQNLAVRMI
jgi:hypothetical protein